MKRILVLLVLTISVALKAQQVDSLKAQDLEAIVVTGQFEPQSIKRSVYQARVIPMEVLAAKGVVRLQDALNTELNIRFEQDAALGGSKLTLQGLAGQNVKVLIDGVPLIGRQGTGNEFDINQINVQSIERIEIIEGPMAVVYGADALAGVINIITKKATDGKLELTTKIHEESVGTEYGLRSGIHNESVSAAYAKNKFHIRTDLSRNYFGGWQGDATGREKQWHPKTQYLADVLAGYVGSKLNFYYRADYLFENIYNPGAFVNGEAFDQRYYSDRFMQQVQGGYKFSAKTQANTVLSYSTFSRETQSTTVDETTGDVRLALGPGQQDVTDFTGLTFRSTVQHKWGDRLTIQPGLEVNAESGSGGRVKAGTQRIGDYALFVSAEWKLSNWLQLRPGLRVLHNTVYTAPPAIPSINAKLTLSERADFRLSYGRGFRAPSLRELYFDFIDANHNIIGNTALEAEFSHSYNASWNYTVFERDKKSLTTVLGGFYNDVDNLIDYSFSNATTATLINVARTKTTGFTFNNTWKSRLWQVAGGMGVTGFYNQYFEDEPNTQQFTWSGEIKTSATFTLPSKGFSVSAYYKFTGITPRYQLGLNNEVYLSKVDSFHWADLSMQKSIGKMFTLTAGTRNLFNITNVQGSASAGGVHTSSAGQSIGSGRSFFTSITYSFNK